MTIQIRGKVWKTGNGYVVTIPKAIVEAGNFKEGDLLHFTVSRQDELEPILAHNALSGVLSRDSKDLSFLGQLSRWSGHHAPTSPDCPDHRVPAFACGRCTVTSDNHEVNRVTN